MPCETDDGNGYLSEIDKAQLLLILRPADQEQVMIRSDRRARDGGRLWVFFPVGEPIVKADGEQTMGTGTGDQGVGISGPAGLIIGRLGWLPRVRRLTLSARADRVREARRRVAAVLGPHHPCLDAAIEVVNELITNAIVYGSRDEHANVDLRVRLLRRRRVRLAVIDEGGTGNAPAIGRPDGDAVNGRGLLIVAAFARRLYWVRHGSGHKVVALLDPLCLGRSLPEPGLPADLDVSGLDGEIGAVVRGRF